jgi:hypothetical protein
VIAYSPPLGDIKGLSIRVVGSKVDQNLNPRPGGITRGKWRILDGKGESDLISDSEL